MSDTSTAVQEQLKAFIRKYGRKFAGEDGPVNFVREVWGAEPDPWQEQVLRAWGRGERRITVRSCHGVGKTTVAAWMSNIQLVTEFPQKVVCTAPTGGQLYDALFAEIVAWNKKLPEWLANLFNPKSDRIELVAAPEESFVTARTSRAENPEALQGIHADSVLLIADEASGVPEAIYEAAAGSMSGHTATTLLTSNPVRGKGFFYDTHNRLADMWFCIHVSHKDSSRVSEEYVEDMKQRYGEDSNVYRVRVLGEFPKRDDDSVIPLEWVELAVERDIRVGPGTPEVWGVDIARFGDDRSALCRRRGNVVPEPVMIWRGVDLMDSVGRIKRKWDETPPSERPVEILIDAIGLGSGVEDRLRELGLPVRGINVSEASSTNAEKFRNLRSELWWKAREWFEQKGCRLPRDPTLVNELVRPSYKYSSTGKVLIQSKDDMKKAKFGSPDAADAFILTFASNAATMSFGGSKSVSWSGPLRRGIKGIV